MSGGRLKKPFQLETAFDLYDVNEVLGEGGAGRVYGAKSSSGCDVAIKVLINATTDHRKRFKNEYSFLSKNVHRNIISVRDQGVSTISSALGPFFVMDRHKENLRVALKRGLTHDQKFEIFKAVLEGVEAAHLLGVLHRDLKPENILVSQEDVVIADFGIARFLAQDLQTLVETSRAKRLANFQYAAPEQRVVDSTANQATDIFALGLILNELFTGVVPHGTDYDPISSVSKEYAYLDDVVASSIRQDQAKRLQSISELKAMINLRSGEHLQKQRLNQIDRTVVPEGEIDNLDALIVPKLVDVKFENNKLYLTLDRVVSDAWAHQLTLGKFDRSWSMNVPPHSFVIRGDAAVVECRGGEAQTVVDKFKQWLAPATAHLRHDLEREADERKRKAEERLRIERKKLKTEMSVNNSLKF